MKYLTLILLLAACGKSDDAPAPVAALSYVCAHTLTQESPRQGFSPAKTVHYFDCVEELTGEVCRARSSIPKPSGDAHNSTDCLGEINWEAL